MTVHIFTLYSVGDAALLQFLEAQPVERGELVGEGPGGDVAQTVVYFREVVTQPTHARHTLRHGLQVVGQAHVQLRDLGGGVRDRS